MVSIVRRLYNRLLATTLSGSAGNRWLNICWVLIGLLYLRATPRFAHTIVRQWPEARGYEYEWIANALASGHGYAFDSGHAWLGPYGSGAKYTLSAWTDPFQTSIMAASFYLFGEYGRLLLVLLNVLWVAATALVIVLCCRRVFSLNIALLTAALFILAQLYVSIPWLYIGNVALTMFMFSLCALCLFRALETPEFRRVLTLGVVIGITHLVHAASILFGPAAASVLVARWGIRRPTTWKNAIVVAILPFVILSPWAVRNYLTFQELVPVRTGFGWQVYIGNVALAMTVAQNQSPKQQPEPPWTAASPREAVQLIRDLEREAALRRHAMSLEVAKAPAGYAGYNEAQRDKYFASLAAAFIRENPRLAAKLAYWRLHAFLFWWDRFTRVITLCALAGILAGWRDLRALGLCAFMFVFTLPYVASVVFYYRYRAPLDPILFMLIGFLLGVTHRRLHKNGGPTTRQSAASV